jgi:hypothetical protein
VNAQVLPEHSRRTWTLRDQDLVQRNQSIFHSNRLAVGLPCPASIPSRPLLHGVRTFDPLKNNSRENVKFFICSKIQKCGRHQAGPFSPGSCCQAALSNPNWPFAKHTGEITDTATGGFHSKQNKKAPRRNARGSCQMHAAVDIEHVSGDVAGFIAGQEHDRRRDFARRAHAAQRNSRL